MVAETAPGMNGPEHSYRYLRPSGLGGGVLGLQTSGGRALRRPAANPLFFTGFVTPAAAAAAGLCSVAKVAAARYFRPLPFPGRDPVVTCSGDRLRFESFSGCGGVYSRLDVLSEALNGEVHDLGTTNVDVGEPLRRMLARVDGRDPLRLTVGPDELRVIAHRPVAGLTPKAAVRMTGGEFRSRFAEVRDAGMKQGCRFLAMVEDTPGTTKADFKRGLAVIRSAFRDNGALR